MQTLAQIFAVGRLVETPEIRKSSSGTTYLNTRMACNNPKRKDEDQTTSYFSFALFGGYAESFAKYAERGTIVQITGNFSPKPYTTKDGRTGINYNIENPIVRILDSNKADTSAPTMANEAAKPVVSMDGFEEIFDGDNPF